MKKILLILLTLFLININVYALNRTDLDNLGVNKKWTINERNRQNVLNTKLVDANDKIYDFSNVLTEEEKAYLKNKSLTFLEKYNMELIIVTDSVPYYDDETNTTYATDFYDYNDFGLNLPHYSGILLFRNTYDLDPYYDMFLFGDAQLYFTYSDMDYILDTIYDDLHAGNYKDGFDSFDNICTRILESGIPSELKNYDIDENGYLVINKEYRRKSAMRSGFIAGSIGSIVISLIFLFVNLSKNKLVTKVNEANLYLDQKHVNYSIYTDKLISTHTTSVYHPPSSSSGGHGGGGYHSSGGSSGGGFSHGGGRHG